MQLMPAPCMPPSAPHPPSLPLDSFSFNCRNDIIVAWQPLPGTNADLTRDDPLNKGNQISVVLTAGAPGMCSHIGLARIFGVHFWCACFSLASATDLHCADGWRAG